MSTWAYSSLFRIGSRLKVGLITR